MNAVTAELSPTRSGLNLVERVNLMHTVVWTITVNEGASKQDILEG